MSREAIRPRRKPKAHRRKKIKEDYPVDPLGLEECSHSELVSIAQDVGVDYASRGVDRTTLITYILGSAEKQLEDPVAGQRSMLHAYIEKKAGTISQANMSCDLQCRSCKHSRVVECYAVNQDLV